MARFFQDRGPVARRGVTKAELPAAATGTGVKGSASHSRPTAALNLPGAGAGHLGEHQRSSVNVNGILPFKVCHPLSADIELGDVSPLAHWALYAP